MPKMTKRLLRQRITRLVTKWRRVMALDHWTIEVFFDLHHAHPDAQGWCDALPCNEDAGLYFNVEKVYAEIYDNAKALEELVVHELAHCIVGSSGTKENERQVTHVTRAVLRSYYREK